MSGTAAGASAQAPQKISVLFVCLGNICRSTMAEGVFRSLTKDPASPYYGVIDQVDSCGTGGFHTGDTPDDRTCDTLRKHGVKDYYHEARQICQGDFDTFDYIFAMDTSNLDNLRRYQARWKATDAKAQVKLFGEYSGTRKSEVVQDPYYSGVNAFEKAYEQCKRFSLNFLRDTFPNIEPAPGSTT
ncbi:Low molecular weight phosphotyrosine protein phosphatase [Diatrype stigma]|uniref:Low molecular weight phosphotyrosine protein phosphatase n=1 Tax=Diatrype stigma TaxID=117547 RepID=A0AAN9U749_9PEZI